MFEVYKVVLVDGISILLLAFIGGMITAWAIKERVEDEVELQRRKGEINGEQLSFVSNKKIHKVQKTVREIEKDNSDGQKTVWVQGQVQISIWENRPFLPTFLPIDLGEDIKVIQPSQYKQGKVALPSKRQGK